MIGASVSGGRASDLEASPGAAGSTEAALVVDHLGDVLGQVLLELGGAIGVEITGGDLLVDLGGGVGHERVDHGLDVDALLAGEVSDRLAVLQRIARARPR